jgi:hypothetical protein
MRTARSLLELLDSFEKDLDDGAFPAIEDLPPEPVAAVTTRPTSRCANPAPLLAAKNSAVPRGAIGKPSLLLAGDPVAAGRKRCALLSRLTGVQQSAIWQCGFIERLVNGLRCMEVGPEKECRGVPRRGRGVGRSQNI